MKSKRKSSRKRRKKKSWNDMSPREKATARKVAKAGIAVGEATVAIWDSMALPTKKLRSAQERFIRKEFKKFNRMRKRVHLPQKSYRRINSKGRLECVK